MSQIDLTQLTELKTINKKLVAGYHICEHDSVLFQQLDQEFDAFEALFEALGHTLIHDARGFYYLQVEDGTVNMGKISRAIALTIYVLIEHFANQGNDPLANLFTQENDLELMMTLVQNNKHLYDQLEIFSGSDLRRDVFLRMVRLGLARESDAGFKVLASAHRYLDALADINQFHTQKSEEL